MSPIFITIVVILVAVFAVAVMYDLKGRRLGDTRSGRDIGKAGRGKRQDSYRRANLWSHGDRRRSN
jgi:hypothetical protein